jgi:Clr5 domain
MYHHPELRLLAMSRKGKGKAVEATPAPAPEEWSAHKDLLRKLHKELTLSKLMERMKEEHKFVAS